MLRQSLEESPIEHVMRRRHPRVCPAAFGEAIIEIQLYSIANQIIPTAQGEVFSGFQPHTTRVHGSAGSKETKKNPRIPYKQQNDQRKAATANQNGSLNVLVSRPRRRVTAPTMWHRRKKIGAELPKGAERDLNI
ncbi:hypothetical protein EVAR_22840_1 [Eumeta japonica]|uniref:Uncharacterized protein n=1 Tax=Eumeta variegata TaxID=151549 RepID=A0A4C1VE23_EUMVA|nr:hypothetical protein EVAR_22840_1 [Eumeta japonica]